MESASTETTTTYAKRQLIIGIRENDIDLFIVKSIDRFYRGGSMLYDSLKASSIATGVTLIDTTLLLVQGES